MSELHTNFVPFLRWAGGKRWLARHLAPFIHQLLKETDKTYIEPFLGAGAMFFCLAPQKSILSDLNSELINSYISVRDNWEKVESIMKGWSIDSETYYKVRSYRPRNKERKAARFIWLNRVCYGGLYRVNKKNEFNVPYGGGTRTPEVLYKNEILRKTSEVIQAKNESQKIVEIIISDFEAIIDRATKGDVVYCDPTYSNVTRDHFDRYGSLIFGWSDQIRLANAANNAFENGTTVIISNGYFSDLLQLFPSAYFVPISKQKTIGNYANNSQKHQEYLFILDPEKRINFWNKFASTMKSTINNCV